MKQEMTLQDFVEICCDRMYNPELPESEQCSGWYALKKMVLEDIPPEGNLINAFHPTLLNFITRHWDKIKALPVGPMKPICTHHKKIDYQPRIQGKSKRGCEQRQCPDCQRWFFHGEFGKGWKSAIRTRPDLKSESTI